MKKIYFLVMMVMMMSGISWGQTTIFSENIGSPSGTTAISSYTGWQNNGVLTYSGTADVRNTTVSSGYSGASGGGNVFLTNTVGRDFQISSINTSSFTSISLSFGVYKSTTAGTGSDLIVEVSSDGSTYSPLSFTALPTGVTGWYLRNATGTIPSTGNLRIKFRQNGIVTQYRIDDVILTGVAILAPTTTSISPSSATAGTSGFTLTVNGTNFVNGISAVRWNGTNKTTTFVSSTQLTATIDAADIASAGTAAVTVLNTGNATESNSQTFTINAASAPTKLVVTSVSPSSPTVSSPFSVTVQAQDNSNNPQNVGSNVTVNLSKTVGTGALSGTLTGTISAGTNSITFTGLSYNIAESGVELTAADGSSTLTSGTTTFTVLPAASQLAFVSVPAGGTVGTNLTSFTVEARRPDNSLDNTYTGNITISKASGPGTLSGTATAAAVAGVATFSSLQFDLAGTYTLSASASGLTGATSGNISISYASASLAGWDVSLMPGGADNFGTNPLAPTTVTPNITLGNLTKGTGVITSGATGAARAWGGVGWDNLTAALNVAANKYITFTAKPNVGYNLSLTSINPFDYRRSSTGTPSVLIQYQINSGSFVDIATLNLSSSASAGASAGPVDLSSIPALQDLPSSSTVTFRIVPYGATSTTGTFYIYDVANTTANDLGINGFVYSVPTITLGSNPSVCQGVTAANLTYSATTQTPDQYSIDYDAAAEAAGFVDVVNASLPASPIVLTVPGAAAAGTYYATLTVRNSGTGISSAGYAISVTVNALPTASITSGNALICSGSSTTIGGSIIATGAWSLVLSNGGGTVTGTGSGTWSQSVTPGVNTTYTITSLSDPNCSAVAGGLTGSANITLATAVGWANLQSPASGTICPSGTFTAYGRVWKDGVTTPGGAPTGITAELGYSTTNSDPSTWTNWQPATFNAQYGNDDEFMSTLSGLLPGTYYYAFRYQSATCSYQYGGYNITGGNFWNGTSNVSGVLTVTGTSTLAASTTCQSLSIGSGTIFTDGSCNAIARLVPSGATPVSGTVNSCVTVDATVQSHNGSPYVQRHFDIEPATNAATATGTVTLYVLQSEFDAYNLVRGALPSLPVSGSNADPNISNIRVTQYHGTGTAPGNYSGTAVLLTPSVNWNGNYWEITVSVNGFSGFYVHSTIGGVLPVNLLTFSGQKQGAVNKLSWTTVSEQNNRGFAVERSADGTNYTEIGFVNTQAVNGNSDASLTYSFTDANPTGSKQYYRLQQQDINGVSRMSNVIVIRGEKASTLAIDGLYPNPANSQLNVALSSPARGTVTLQVVDMTGRILVQQVKAIAEGSNTVSLNVAGLSNGSYILKVVNAETGAVSAKFSKQ